MSQRGYRVLFVLLVAALVYASLYPWTFLDAPRAVGMRWIPAASRALQLDVVVNLLGYVPLGFVGALAFRSWWGRLLVWVGGSVLSFGVEYLQLWTPGRDSSFRDVLWNSVGMLVGVVCGIWAERSLGLDRMTLRWKRSADAWLLMALWIAGQTFPFFPSLRLVKLRTMIELWLHPTFSFLGMGDGIVAGVVLALLASKAGLRFVVVVPGVMFVLMGRVFVVGTSLPLPVVVWTMVGLALGWKLRRQAGLMAALLVSWLVARELYPFTFERHPSQFHWGLFSTVLEADRIGVIRILAGKLFVYVSAMWAMREAGMRLPLATGVVLVVLGVGEWLQRYLPGRTPELTDLILAVVGAVLLRAAGRR